MASFHPAVAAWFEASFAAPTAAQEHAWPAIQAARHVLVAAPTGSGKTLAAFLAAIDALVREGIAAGLPDETRVLYVSPLKALSNDVQRNLDEPIAGIRRELAARGCPDVDLRTMVRTGDTTPAERSRMRRRPPHIVATTPESFYVLLGSASGRTLLSTVRTVIVDEIHAIAANKRGAHLALSLERLNALTVAPCVRIGLSATQNPIDEVARFLVGSAPERGECVIVDGGHLRRRDLALEVPPVPLEAVMSGDTWLHVYDRLAELARAHRTTLVFVNTRRMAERVARHLAERLGEKHVGAHHGSLAKERRLAAEQKLKRGELQVLIATASLELGIDIGHVDLVCQLGSTRSINVFLQRVGRAGHAVGGTSKGRLFPLSRDELVECTALLDAVRRGELDRLSIPTDALDVLTQHIAAEVATREWPEARLFDLVRGAWPYRQLPRADFDACLEMLAHGFSTRRGRHGALVHRDAVNGVLRPRKGAGLTALTSGGAIPDTADYKVVLEPDGFAVGSVNEDFAVESLQGDIFQLGNASYKILRVERGTVRVADAQGQPPSIPFWLGEAPGRTAELSHAVSRLRTEIGVRLDEDAGTGTNSAAHRWLAQEVGVGQGAASQLIEYLGSGRAALRCMPSAGAVVFERFFDESGGMQLVIHSPFGSRVNRAWGLSLRKRFCRTFNVELQAAATEDHIVLSLTQAHSFELAAVARYLHSRTARQVLVQALCAAPMFGVRWRWASGIALALPRFRGGRKLAPQIIRMNAEDLLAAVFPDQAACAENLPGEIEIPEHPLVRQTIRDCLDEAMDVSGFEQVLRGIEGGEIAVHAVDLVQPSPFALEALNARPYAYLDDAPLEERRAQAVMARRWIDAASAADLGRLDAAAIARVRAEAWPDAESADELCDAISILTCLTDHEVRAHAHWPRFTEELERSGRLRRIAPGPGTVLWMTPESREALAGDWPPTDAGVLALVRGRLEGLGPTTASALAEPLELPSARVASALGVLEAQGVVLRGRFTPEAAGEEWCERRLLARIHRYTVKRLRNEIEPVSTREFLRFLCEWQRAAPGSLMQGADAVAAILAQLEGFEAPAGAWEGAILRGRIADYDPHWLDEQGRAGRFAWVRLQPRGGDSDRSPVPIRSTPLTMLSRRALKTWLSLTEAHDSNRLSYKPRAVLDVIQAQGASFFEEIAEAVPMLPGETEEALRELAALGLVHADSFGGLRALLMSSSRRAGGRGDPGRRGRRPQWITMADAGRWSAVRRAGADAAMPPAEEVVEHVVRALLRRWGVIFWKLLAREADWLPSWRDIFFCCRRLEARGEIRGGRFLAGVSGEQFASPEAVAALRGLKNREFDAGYLSLSAADPLNLLGILTPGDRLPALTGNRLLYRDGLPIATLSAGEVAFRAQLDPSEQWRAREALLRTAGAAPAMPAAAIGKR